MSWACRRRMAEVEFRPRPRTLTPALSRSTGRGRRGADVGAAARAHARTRAPAADLTPAAGWPRSAIVRVTGRRPAARQGNQGTGAERGPTHTMTFWQSVQYAAGMGGHFHWVLLG